MVHWNERYRCIITAQMQFEESEQPLECVKLINSICNGQIKIYANLKPIRFTFMDSLLQNFKWIAI